MSDLQVPTAPAASGDGSGMQGRPVTEADLSRFRSSMDKQLSKAHKALVYERKRANSAEGQLRQLLNASEKQMLATMKPEERARYLAQKRDKDLLTTKKENSRLRKQSRLDAERDRVLRQYGLRGDEQGIDYSNWERFVSTAHATSVKRQAQIQQALRKTRGAPDATQETSEDTTTVAGEQAAASTENRTTTSSTAARVDTAGPIRVRPVVGSSETIEKAAWSLTKGNPADRRAALENLKRARAEAVGA